MAVAFAQRAPAGPVTEQRGLSQGVRAITRTSQEHHVGNRPGSAGH